MSCFPWMYEAANAELFAIAIQGAFEGDTEDEFSEPPNAVSVLCLRGTSEVFDIASEWAVSPRWKERAVAMRVLALLKGEEHKPRSLVIATDALKDEHPDVASLAAWAVAHLRNVDEESATATLISLKSHPDNDIRLAVATGLGGCCERPDAMEVLIELTRDPCDDVRDWAAFGLGMADTASPAAVLALQRLLDDTFQAARAEARWALAIWRQTDGLRAVLREFENDECWRGDWLIAAEVLGQGDDATRERTIQDLRALLAEAT